MVEEEPLSENQTIQAGINNFSQIVTILTNENYLKLSIDVFIFLGNRYDVRQIEKSSLPNVVSNEPCLCEPSNLNMDGEFWVYPVLPFLLFLAFLSSFFVSKIILERRPWCVRNKLLL